MIHSGLLITLGLGLLSAAPTGQPPAGPLECSIRADSVLATPRFAPAKLLDGNATDVESRWASARSKEPHWVAIRFDRPVAIDRVVVHGHREADLVPRSAELQVAVADAWETVASTENNEQAVVELRFPRRQCDAIRLWITKACRRDSTARLFEIELFCAEEPIAIAARQESGRAAPPPPPVPDDVLLASVSPMPERLFKRPGGDPRNQRLLDAYHRAVSAWADVLAGHIEPVPGRPGQGYYGRGGHGEDDVRPIAYAAMVNALLSRIEPPSQPVDENVRRQRREDAIAALGYLTSSHVTGETACLDGKPWGDAWQSAMWTRAAALGAWALWPELDRDTRLAVARMIEHEADRFLDRMPKSSRFQDTGAEENAWNALVLSLASNMMPRHPRAPDWGQAAKRYMYNVMSVAADAEDDAPGDDGIAVRQWVSTVNAHPDFTVENHGLVHVGYQKTSLAQLMENAIHYLIAGSEVPKACMHHVPDGVELLYRCSAWDGAPVFFGGNDWKTFHSQPIDLVIYALLSTVAGDRRAAYLEQTGLTWLGRMQQAEGGYFNVRRDLEYGGACATRLLACYLAHAVLGAGAEPLSSAEFDRAASGVRLLPAGKAIVHRTPTKFASLAWGPKRMALSLPRDGNWIVWPHFASYLGLVDGEAPSEDRARLVRISHRLIPDGFWAVGQLSRCGGRARHDFAFVSPPADVTFYFERIRAAPDFRYTERETGIVGHEYELGTNHREIHGRFGTVRVEGVGNQSSVREMATDWLNLDNRVGYVVRRVPETANVVRYHDESRGSGRVPQLQEWFSLVNGVASKETAADADHTAIPDQWACIVTYLNQTAEATDHFSREVSFRIDGDAAICSAPIGAGPGNADNLGASRVAVRVDFAAGLVELQDREEKP